MFSVKFQTLKHSTPTLPRIQCLFYNARLASLKSKDSSLKSWKEIPGPSSLPFLGQLHHFIPGGFLYKITGQEFWGRLYKSYGPIVRLNAVLKPNIIVIFDAEETADVYRHENWLPIRPVLFSLEYFRKYYNRPKDHHLKLTGLVTENGERWKRVRSIVNAAMLNPKNVKSYTNVTDDVALDMIKRLKRQRDDHNMLIGEFDKEMNMWALESISVVALGCRINCLDPNVDDALVLKLIKLVHEIFEIAAKLDFKPSIWKYYATNNFKHAMKVYKDVEDITKYFIDTASENLKVKRAKNNLSNEESSVLEKLLEIDENIAHVMSVDMILAGVDTTSNTMTAVLYHLASNPIKQQKLREELNLNQKTPYLKACIKESLRLLPVIGVNMRKTTKDYEIMGYEIPKDTSLLFCHQYMTRMDKYFPKPNEFIPERWLDDQMDPHHGTGNKFSYMPFGFGARICIGKRMAELQLEVFLKRIMENFDIGWSGPPPRIDATHINRVTTHNNFIFKDIQPSISSKSKEA